MTKAFRLSSIYHVGQKPQMDPARQLVRSDSYEGPGLSVSLDPDAWEEIARLGGQPWWELCRQDGRKGVFIDMLALLRSPQGKVLLEAAVERGWITFSKAWKVSLYDDEIEEYVYSYFDDKADAEEELEECLYGGTPGKLEEVILPVALQPLKDRWAVYFRRPLDKMMAEDFAILQIIEEQGFYDGAWWDEKYDPITLSAPRGVIFVSKLPEWVATPIAP